MIHKHLAVVGHPENYDDDVAFYHDMTVEQAAEAFEAEQLELLGETHGETPTIYVNFVLASDSPITIVARDV